MAPELLHVGGSGRPQRQYLDLRVVSLCMNINFKHDDDASSSSQCRIRGDTSDVSSRLAELGSLKMQRAPPESN